ncbi:hypothetical protein Mapa_007855 [Marchantia paleacea]|nr:hypothetical protein Mapa_007855 [Marchantia paleacea]
MSNSPLTVVDWHDVLRQSSGEDHGRRCGEVTIPGKNERISRLTCRQNRCLNSTRRTIHQEKCGVCTEQRGGFGLSFGYDALRREEIVQLRKLGQVMSKGTISHRFQHTRRGPAPPTVSGKMEGSSILRCALCQRFQERNFRISSASAAIDLLNTC